MTNLMNVNTGSVQTRAEWIADFKASELHEWLGYETLEEMKEAGECRVWSHMLVAVEQNENGEWVEV